MTRINSIHSLSQGETVFLYKPSSSLEADFVPDPPLPPPLFFTHTTREATF